MFFTDGAGMRLPARLSPGFQASAYPLRRLVKFLLIFGAYRDTDPLKRHLRLVKLQLLTQLGRTVERLRVQRRQYHNGKAVLADRLFSVSERLQLSGTAFCTLTVCISLQICTDCFLDFSTHSKHILPHV